MNWKEIGIFATLGVIPGALSPFMESSVPALLRIGLVILAMIHFGSGKQQAPFQSAFFAMALSVMASFLIVAIMWPFKQPDWDMPVHPAVYLPLLFAFQAAIWGALAGSAAMLWNRNQPTDTDSAP